MHRIILRLLVYLACVSDGRRVRFSEKQVSKESSGTLGYATDRGESTDVFVELFFAWCSTSAFNPAAAGVQFQDQRVVLASRSLAALQRHCEVEGKATPTFIDTVEAIGTAEQHVDIGHLRRNKASSKKIGSSSTETGASSRERGALSQASLEEPPVGATPEDKIAALKRGQKMMMELAVMCSTPTPLEELVPGSRVDGKVVRKVASGVLVDIGAEVDALLHAEDISDDPTKGLVEKLSVGDTVSARIATVNPEKQNVTLTCKQGLPLEKLAVGMEVEGAVVRIERPWGAFLDIGALKHAVLHKSDISDEGVADITEKVTLGQSFRCRIKAINLDQQQVSLTIRESALLNNLEVGAEVEGKVRRLSPLGAFVDIGESRRALLPISEIPLEPMQKIEDKISVDEVLHFRIKCVDLEKNRVALTRKGYSTPKKEVKVSTSRTPLEELQIGAEVEGKILRLESTGFLVDIGASQDALLHKSDITKESMVDIIKNVTAGNKIKCRIKDIDMEKRHLSLTSKRKNLEELEIGTAVQGKVTNIARFGVFLDIGTSRDALLWKSEMSDAHITNIKKSFTVGESVECFVHTIDLGKQSVTLTCKSAVKPLEELKIDTVVQGRVVSLASFGAFLDIGTSHNALLPNSEMSEEVKKKLSVGVKLRCRVQSLDAERQRIGLACNSDRQSLDQQQVWNGTDEPMQKITLSEGEEAKAPIKTINSAEKQAGSNLEAARIPLEELAVGMEVEGSVTSITPHDIYLDIGAMDSGRLRKQEIPDKDKGNIRQRIAAGKSVKCRIKEIDLENQKFSLTCKKAVKLLEELEIGTLVEGKVTNLASFGAFVDIGTSCDALLWKNEISDEPIEDITKRFTVGESVKCQIQSIDLDKQRVTLTGRIEGRKSLQEFEIDSEVTGKILRLASFGAFVDIGAYKEALLRKSEMSDEPIEDITKRFTVGESVKCLVKTVDLEKQEITLTSKRKKHQVGLNRRAKKGRFAEFERIPLEELEVGEEVEGKVQKDTLEAIWLDIGANVDGRLRKLEISDQALQAITKRVAEGKSVQCRIKEIDLENQRLSLTCEKAVKLPEEQQIIVSSKESKSLDNSEEVTRPRKTINLDEHQVGLTREEVRRPLEKPKVGMEVEGKITEENSTPTDKDKINSLEPLSAMSRNGALAGADLPVEKRLDGPIQKITQGLSVSEEATSRIMNKYPKEVRTPLEELKVGTEVEGELLRITAHDIYLDIGATVDGKLRKLEISDKDKEEIRQRVAAGKSVKCRIKQIDLENQQISLTCKKAVKPLEDLEIGDLVQGKVEGLASFGAFVDIGTSRNALLPNSAMSEEIKKKLSVGVKLNCRVKLVDVERQRISLTCRNERKSLDQFQVGAEVEGNVLQLASFGAFVDIGAYNDALLPKPEISDNVIEDITNRLSVGQKVKCTIQNIDLEKQQVTLTYEEATTLLEQVAAGKITTTVDQQQVQNGTSVADHLHVEEMPDEPMQKTAKKLSEGEEVKTPIKTINSAERQAGYNLKELKVGMEVEGSVAGTTVDDIYIDIGANVNGRLRKLEISDNENEDMRQRVAAGKSVKCRIKYINLENQQLSLTCKKAVKPLVDLEIGDLVEGKIMSLASYGAFLDIGASLDALLPKSEMADEPIDDITKRFTVGESVKCRIIKIDLKKQRITLCSKEVKTQDEVEEVSNTLIEAVPESNARIPTQELDIGTEVKGKIVSLDPFGVMVDIGASLLALLPVREMLDEDIQNTMEKFSVGAEVTGRIKTINPENQQVTLTCKALGTPLKELEIGSEVEGKVFHVQPFGVFLDIGASHYAMLHQADISDTSDNIAKMFKVGESVMCRIKDIDLEKQQIGLHSREGPSLDNFEVGAELEGKVVRLEPWGAFVDIGAFYNALLNKSDMSDDIIADMTEQVVLGRTVKCQIKDVNLNKRQVSVTCKHRIPLINLQMGEEVEGKVVRLEPWGASVDIGALHDAMLHKSEISLDPMENLNDKFSVDDVVRCKIKDIDLKNNKINLTCREYSTDTEKVAVSTTRTPLEKLEVDTDVKGKVVGLLVDIGASAVALSVGGKTPEKFSVGEEVTGRITSINEEKKHVSLMCKQARTPLEALNYGTEIEGKILRLASYGAFVDIGASRDALLPKNEISDEPIEDITNMLAEGETVKCKVKKINLEKQRVSLTCKEVGTPVEELKVGAEVEGKVVRLAPFGVFVDIGASNDALLRKSEISDEPSEDFTKRFSVGNSIKCRIKTVDLGKQQITLGSMESKTLDKLEEVSSPLKTVTLDEHQSGLTRKEVRIPLTKLEVGMEVEGKITQANDDDIYLDIGATVDGRLRKMELSDKDKEDIRQRVAAGKSVKCRIRDINLQKQFLDLTCKKAVQAVEELKVGTVVEGKVTGLASFGVFLDIGTARNALLPNTEISDEPIEDIMNKITVGAKVRCRVMSVDAEKQEVTVTCKRRRKPLEELQAGSEVEGKVMRLQPYGAFIDIGASTDALLPKSEISSEPIEDIAKRIHVGQNVKCRILETDLDKQQVTLTFKQQFQALDNLELGAEVEGQVVGVNPWGVFVDIGAWKDALLHVSEISLEPSQTVHDKFSLDEIVTCRIKDIDAKSEKVTLTCKEYSTPIEEVKISAPEKPEIDTVDKNSINLGKNEISLPGREVKTPLGELMTWSEVKGKILRLASFGAFVDIGASRDALLPTNEISDKSIEDISKMLSVGESVNCRIKRVDLEKQQVTLTCKGGTPLEELEVGAPVEGKVLRLAPFGGVFVDIGASYDALLPKSEISEDDFTKVFNVGQTIKCHIQSLDLEQQKVSVTCRKQGIELADAEIGSEIEGEVTEEVKISTASIPVEALKVGKDAEVKTATPKPLSVSVHSGSLATETMSLQEDEPMQNVTNTLPLSELSGQIQTTSPQKVGLTRQEIRTPLEELQIGAEIEGKVLRSEATGFVVDVGACQDALLHKSDISVESFLDTVKKATEGKSIKCRIKDIDIEKRQLSLTNKRKPLEELEVGTEVEGTVLRQSAFGPFLDIGASHDALLWKDDLLKDLAVGEKVRCRIKRVDIERERISLTSREGTPLQKLEINTEVEGNILQVRDFGAFVDIGASHAALLPKNEISDEPVEDMTKTLAVGESVKCRIKTIDLEKEQVFVTCKEAGTPLEEFRVGAEVEGKVLRWAPFGVFVDIGASRDALLHNSQMEDTTKKFTMGQSVKCTIGDIDLQNNKITLQSIKASDISDKVFSRIPLSELEVGAEVEGKVTMETVHDIILDVGASSASGAIYGQLRKLELSDKNTEYIRQMVNAGEMIKCQIKEVDVKKRKLSLTCKEERAMEEPEIEEPEIEEPKIDTEVEDPLEQMKPGTQVEGRITQLLSFCAFVDIGRDISGLLHISEMAEYVEDITEKYSVGQTVKCRIKSIDLKGKKAELTCKEVIPADHFAVGKEVEGKVVRLEPWGAFVDVGAFNRALLHVSEISDEPVYNIGEKLSVGEIVKCRIKDVDLERSQISLTCKEGSAPAEDLAGVEGNAPTVEQPDLRNTLEDFEVDSLLDYAEDVGSAAKVEGKAVNAEPLNVRTPLEELKVGIEVEGKITGSLPYGVFLDIGATREALLRKDDVSDQDMDVIKKVVTAGKKIKCRIKDIDLEKQQITLTAKKGKLPEEFEVGTEIEGKVLRVTTFGVFFDIGSVQDALLPRSQMTGDEFLLPVGESVMCRIFEVDLDKQEITLTRKRDAVPEQAINLDDFEAGFQSAAEQIKGTPLYMLEVGTECEGKIKAISGDNVWVDIGASTDGRIHRYELAKSVAVGQILRCRIKTVDDGKNQLWLTCKDEDFDGKHLEEFLAGDEVEGKVVAVRDDHALIDIGARDLAHLKLARLGDNASALVKGASVSCRVQRIDFQHQKIHVIPSDDPFLRIEELQVGMYVSGRVTMLTDKGAYLDIGAESDAFMPKTSVASNWNKKELRRKLAGEDTVECRIFRIDTLKRTIHVTARLNGIEVGTKVRGTVESFTSYGIKLDIGSTHGLLLQKEVEKEGFSVADFTPGQLVECRVDRIKWEEMGTISFTLKKEFKRAEEFQVGQEVSGVVVSALSGAAFVDIGALRDVRFPYEEKWTDVYLAEGDHVNARVKYIDAETQEIGLTHFLYDEYGERLDY